jgi:hypothetical protein
MRSVTEIVDRDLGHDAAFALARVERVAHEE